MCAALCWMDAGQPAGAGIARNIPALALGPHKPAGLDRQGAAQKRKAEILPGTLRSRWNSAAVTPYASSAEVK